MIQINMKEMRGKKRMCETEGVGRCLLRYDHDGNHVACGMTFFQCGTTPIIILTDIGSSTSITNSIESAASNVYAMHFLHVKPNEIIFFEHYHRDNGSDDFYQVKMRWDAFSERYTNPEFTPTTKEVLLHLLSCYGYRKGKIPDLRFLPAKVLPFSR